MNIKNIISEEINNFLKEKCMLREYKNPKDSETVRVCGDMLEEVYNRIIQNGVSKREITVKTMGNIIGELRHLEEMMK